jgi:hypothetical protein
MSESNDLLVAITVRISEAKADILERIGALHRELRHRGDLDRISLDAVGRIDRRASDMEADVRALREVSYGLLERVLRLEAEIRELRKKE